MAFRASHSRIEFLSFLGLKDSSIAKSFIVITIYIHKMPASRYYFFRVSSF